MTRVLISVVIALAFAGAMYLGNVAAQAVAGVMP